MAKKQEKKVGLPDGLTAVFDSIFVRVDEAEKETPGGIIVPDVAQKRPKMGTVVACGPGAYDRNGNFQAMPVKVGDRVLYGEYSGQDCRFGDEVFRVVRVVEILAKIAKEDGE